VAVLTVILFANGDYKNPNFYLEYLSKYNSKEYYVICADGGANHALSLGLTPDMVVGDLDSLDDVVCQRLTGSKCQFHKFPSAKNESDLELAMKHALDLKPREIIVFGATGGRMDHAFANIMLLMLPLSRGIKTVIVDEIHEMQLMDKELTVEGIPGDFVSLFPLTAEAQGVVTRGLKYPLKNETLYVSASRGLSNELTGSIAHISITQGCLLVVKVKKEQASF